jgi:hypothetical protein
LLFFLAKALTETEGFTDKFKNVLLPQEYYQTGEMARFG